MKKVPSFLEQLFDHENLEFRFDFNDEAIDVKASKNVMVNLKKAVQKILQDNSAILKEAYLKDLKKKFPFKIYVDMNSNRVLFDTQNNLAMYSKFMSKVFEDAVVAYNSKNSKNSKRLDASAVNILMEYFNAHGWKKENANNLPNAPKMLPVFDKDVKSAEQLQIILSQLCNILDDQLNLDSYIKSWKSFFKD